MPRRLLERSHHLPYFVSARANNRDPFRPDIERFWQIVSQECLVQTFVYQVEFHAVVLLPSQIYMLLTVPDHDLGIVMREWKRSVSKRSNLISGRSGHVFEGPYRWSILNDPRYYGHALKYAYRSPIRDGLCYRVEDYRHSTLHGLIGRSHLPFPLYFTRVEMERALPSLENAQHLEWLNQPFPIEAETLIKKGFRQKFLNAVIDRRTRKPSDLLTRLL